VWSMYLLGVICPRWLGRRMAYCIRSNNI